MERGYMLVLLIAVVVIVIIGYIVYKLLIDTLRDADHH